MLFNSWTYLLFLGLVVGLYWALPRRYRISLIVLASLGFYAMWRWEFCLLVVFSAVVDFVCSGRIAGSSTARNRKRWLLASLVINLGLLAFFKYTYFAYDNIRSLGTALRIHLPAHESWALKIILPLGISFYTFQTISYTIDVYRGVIKPIDRFPTFLAYVMFWPQLVAGPILRCGEVVPELLARRRFRIDDFAIGVQRIVQGLFKKVVLADSLAPMVDYWFEQSQAGLTAIDVWVACFLFGFQIYFDFAGYSDIAIGSARLLGIRFPENFDWPYLARSPRDFWKRWHISLSAWIRDYLYVPLTGRRYQVSSRDGIAVAARGRVGYRQAWALMLTWCIMGLWHGAAWTFVVWGLYHGSLVLAYRLTPWLRRLPERFPRLGWLVMLAAVMLGWLPFRAHSLSQACHWLLKVINPLEYSLSPWVTGLSVRIAGYSYLAAAVLTVAMPLWHKLRQVGRRTPADSPFPADVLHAAVLTAMVFAVILCMQAKQQFIYFQF